MTKELTRYSVYAAIIFSSLLFTNCASTNIQEKDTQYLQSKLYCGLATPEADVTEKQWNDFIDSYVTPKFKQGFTVINAYGQWRSKSGEIIKEKSINCKSN